MEQFDFNFFGEDENDNAIEGKQAITELPPKPPVPSPEPNKQPTEDKKQKEDSSLDDFNPFQKGETTEESSAEENPYTILGRNFFEYLGWDNWSDDILTEKSAEGFFNMLESIIQENSIPQYSSEIVQEFDNFVRSGGNPKDFLNTYNETELPDLDLENQEHQAYVIYQQMKMSTHWSDDKIKKYINKLAKDGELMDEAKDAFDFVKGQYEQRRVQLKQQQELEIQRQQQEMQENIVSIGKFIASATEEELGVPLTKGEKQNFIRFLLEPDPKTGRTKYQEKLEENPANNYKLAALVFKGALDGKLDSIAKKKVVNDLEEKLKKSASTMFSKQSNKMNITPNNDISFSDLF